MLCGRILVAEDNPVNQVVAVGLLEALGLEADVVSEGQAALDALTRTPDRWDLLLTDVQMPRLDGLDLVRTLREREWTHPIVVVSAGAMRSDVEQAHAAGCNAHLKKPIRREELHAVLLELLPDSSCRPATTP